MSTILDIPEIRRRVARLSVEDYHRLEEYNEHGRRTELIRGFLIEKMSKSPLHRTVASLLYRLLLARLPKGYAVWKEEPMTLADSEPEPDISVTRGEEADFALVHPTTAELVVEIAVTNPELDRANASLYAEALVKEYWIVLARDRKVEVLRQPEAGRYQQVQTFGEHDLLMSSVLPDIQLQVSELFLPTSQAAP